MIARDNAVRIWFYDGEGNKIDIYKDNAFNSDWKVECGTPVITKGQQVKGEVSYWCIDAGNRTPPSNEIEVRLKCGRSRTEEVAMNYLDAGYGTNVSSSKSSHWPKFSSIPVNNTSKYSATMSVNGDSKMPKELNFYIPVRITTDKGFVMNLFLGQTGTGDGWINNIKELKELGTSAYEGFEDFEEGDAFGVLYESYEFAEALKKLFDAENPWYLTSVGTEQYPSALIPSTKVGVDNYVGITCVGETTDGQRQMGYFYVENADDVNDYTFKVRIYDLKN